MARFQCGDAIWQIVLRDCVVEIGKTTRRFVTAAQARALYDKLIAEKLAAGYVPIADPPPKPVRKATTLDPRSPDLERAIVGDPEDRDAFRVYGDWLQQHDDARGEWIGHLAAAAREPERGADGVRSLSHTRASRCFHKHRAYVEGVLADATVEWRDGFARRIAVDYAGATVAAVLTHPSARFATRVTLIEHGKRDDGALAILVRHAPATLREVELEIATSLDESIGGLPALRRLAIRPRTGRDARLGERAVEALARASWPALERLALGPFAVEVTADQLARLCALAAPALTHLRLRGPIAQLVDPIARSPLASQLNVLELRGAIEEADVARLAAARFSNLRELWLGGVDELPRAWLGRLAGLATHVLDIAKETAPALRARYNPLGE